MNRGATKWVVGLVVIFTFVISFALVFAMLPGMGAMASVKPLAFGLSGSFLGVTLALYLSERERRQQRLEAYRVLVRNVQHAVKTDSERLGLMKKMLQGERGAFMVPTFNFDFRFMRSVALDLARETSNWQLNERIQYFRYELEHLGNKVAMLQSARLADADQAHDGKTRIRKKELRANMLQHCEDLGPVLAEVQELVEQELIRFGWSSSVTPR